MDKMAAPSSEGFEVVLIHGYPGAGKGTQCKKIAKNYAFTHLSVGDLLRTEMKEENPLSKMISGYVMEGNVVPAKLMCDVIFKAMENTNHRNFLIDGYPRSYHGLERWQEFVKRHNINIRLVMQLKCDKEICKTRILENVKQKYRTDDDGNILDKRIEAYDSLMGPIKNTYATIWENVEGNDTPEKTFDIVKEVLERHGYEKDTTAEQTTPSSTPVKNEEEVSKLEHYVSDPSTSKGVSLEELSLPLKGCTVVLVHGYPGAGKSTQCLSLAKCFGFKHISVGDLMRKEMEKETIASEEIRSHVMEGKIVPVQLTSEVLKKCLKNAVDESEVKKFLIDGHPRDTSNLDEWKKLVAGSEIKVKFVLQMNCKKETCRKRILDSDGRGRPDDNPEILEKRFKTYEELMEPIRRYYQSERLLREIHGEGTPDQVFARVTELFEKEGLSKVHSQSNSEGFNDVSIKLAVIITIVSVLLTIFLMNQ